LSATLTAGTALPGKSVSFTLNGSPVGSATTNSAGVATLANVSLGTTAPGSYATGVAASFGGDVDDLPSSGTNSLSVTKATLTVTADNKSRLYGDANPTFTASYAGLKNGETLATSGVTGSPSLTTSAAAASPVGSYTITAALGTLAAGNYQFSFVDGTLSVTKASLTITADAKSKTYGDANPTFTVSYAGFVNSDTSASLGGTLAFTTSATAASPVGSYSVTPSGLTSSNYAISFVPGTLTIGPRTLTITASGRTKTYGDTLTLGTSAFTSTGLVNGDTVTSVTLTSAGAAAGAAVGSYPVQPSAAVFGVGSASNYTIGYVDGTLVVSYRFDGFLQPINDTAHATTCGNPCPYSVFKAGSTVPVKFQLKDAAGNVVQAATLPAWAVPAKGGVASAAVDEAVYADLPTSGGSFRWDGSQYIYNWSTKGLQAGYYYRVGWTLPDGESGSVVIALR
jgi:hypothetical protein